MKKIALTAPNGYFKNFFKAFSNSALNQNIEYKVCVDVEDTTVTFKPKKNKDIEPSEAVELISLWKNNK